MHLSVLIANKGQYTFILGSGDDEMKRDGPLTAAMIVLTGQRVRQQVRTAAASPQRRQETD
jgi:hypothetical protein